MASGDVGLAIVLLAGIAPALRMAKAMYDGPLAADHGRSHAMVVGSGIANRTAAS